MTEQRQILDDLARQIVRLSPTRIIRVAIDGVDGAGKTTFANDLASAVVQLNRPVIRASVDGFHNPRSVRYARGKQSPEGFFRDSYNYSALKHLLLDPLGSTGDRRYHTAAFDHVTDMAVPLIERLALPSSILLLDGIFLHRSELLSCWDASIFLKVDFAVSIARCATRDGTSPDPEASTNHRYVEGQRIYLAMCNPEAHATIIIDYNDLSEPTVLANRGS